MPDRIQVVWYTDPHNVWCWGCEPAIRRVEVLYPDSVEIGTRMGGLFEDFGPLREQWARMSGGRWKDSVLAFFEAVAAQHRMPMDAARMVETVDDFNSTWPACIAAKAADLQGREIGRRYLRRLREGWAVEGRGIHRRAVQEELASEAGLDVEALRKALEDGSAERAFRKDREECEELGITGFPTFEIRSGEETARMEGWQPWETFDEVLRKLDPDLRPFEMGAGDAAIRDLLHRYDRCATREIAAVLSVTDDDAEIFLEELEGRGEVLRRPAGNGLLWELTDSRKSAPPEKHFHPPPSSGYA